MLVVLVWIVSEMLHRTSTKSEIEILISKSWAVYGTTPPPVKSIFEESYIPLLFFPLSATLVIS